MEPGTTFTGVHNENTVEMARYVHPEVETLLDSEPRDERARLAVVPLDEGAETVRERINQLGANVERTLPSGVLLVEVSVSELRALLDVDGIASIAPDSQMEVLV